MTYVTEGNHGAVPAAEHNDAVAAGQTRAGLSGHGRFGPVIAAVIILLGAGVVLFDAVRIGIAGGFGPQQPGLVPIVVGVGLVVLALAFLVRTTLVPDQDLAAKASSAQEAVHWRTLWTVAFALIVYAFALTPLGYVLATALFIVAATALAGSRAWIRNVLVGVLFALVVYLGFTYLLGVRLPGGILEGVL